MALHNTSIWRSAAPARPGIAAVLAGTAISIVALTALVALGVASGQILLMPPMAATMALIAGAPTLPLSQPRSVIGGQLLSACGGVGVGYLSHSLWAAAIAGGLALGAMMLARMSHSPAAATAATAVIAVMVPSGQLRFVLCVGVASFLLVAFGWARSALGRTKYPVYRW